MKKIIILASILLIGITAIDYFNLPSTFLGLKISNMNWDFYMGILNVFSVVILYVITYILLDQREIKRDRNKNEIATLLIRKSYDQCIFYINNMLTEDMINNYIVPKMDFNSTDNPIMMYLKSAPFENENHIMDLVKDGQITKKKLEDYFNVKDKFSSYVFMRITFFDAPEKCSDLKIELLDLIRVEIAKINDIL